MKLLLTIVVALLVFGPKRLPEMAQHLAWCVKTIRYYRQQILQLWQAELDKQQLAENLRKAKAADVHYD